MWKNSNLFFGDVPRLTVGSLFSGIGGIDLGLELAGMKTVWQVENEPYCVSVLHRLWPDVPKYNDVRFCREGFNELPPVDVICGGFPCQDISLAGKKAGLSGERSGLWYEFARIIHDLQPNYVFVENVSNLRALGLDQVLKDLAESGYDAEWDSLPASLFGAPHKRERLFIIAYSSSLRRYSRRSEQSLQGIRSSSETPETQVFTYANDYVDTNGTIKRRPIQQRPWWSESNGIHTPKSETSSDTDGVRLSNASKRPSTLSIATSEREAETITYSYNVGRMVRQVFIRDSKGFCQPRDKSITFSIGSDDYSGFGQWGTEPGVRGVADGVPYRMERLRSLGNAVVPEIARWIGERIISFHRKRLGI